MTVDLAYTVTTGKTFEETVQAVLDAVAAKGFRVLHIHDVQATFAEKGITREPYKIIEVCNVKYAHQALQADSLVGLMMPCKINVFSERSATKLALLNPSLLAQFFPQAKLEALSQEIETLLRAVVDAAK
jgi:uncharacterized protein (DUF302 family)